MTSRETAGAAFPERGAAPVRGAGERAPSERGAPGGTDAGCGGAAPAGRVDGPEAALSVLADCRDPYLIGVRHHSPALAAAVPALLDAAAPEVLFIELPEEFAPWLDHVGDPATTPPIALAGSSGGGLVFLPFAEFSPELAAVRWARGAGVEVIPFDLPLAARTAEAGTRAAPADPAASTAPGPGGTVHAGQAGRPSEGGAPGAGGPAPAPSAPAPVSSAPAPAGRLAAALRARAGGRPGDDLWDRLVEAAAPGGEPEALRRAALLVGWALRTDAGPVDAYDLRREANMRRRLAEHRGRRAAAIVGAFHAPALTGGRPGAEASGAEGTALSAASPRATAEAPGEPGSRPTAPGSLVPQDAGAGETVGTGGAAGTGVPPARTATGETGKPADGAGPGAGPALAPGPARPHGAGSAGGGEVVTSLVPYAYALLDERSGYPAGIRDPEWQHGVFRAAGDPRLMDELLTATAVRICAAVREEGHPSGPADAREVVRVARDLATLRGLPAAGRGELVEAVQTVLTQGRLLERGRVVASALERVLVGVRQGRLAPGTPRSGLGPSVEALFAELRLPGPDERDPRELRLDMLRSDLDRRREIALRRLAVCGIPYGEESGVAGVGEAAALTTRWSVAWSPSTAAMLDVAGLHGVTLEQATAGVLRRRRTDEHRRGGPTAAEVLDGLASAASCALPALAAERLAETAELLPATGTLPELLAGMELLDRIRSGHVPGLAAPWRRPELDAAHEELASAGVRALDGLAGSTAPADAHALVTLAGQTAAVGGGLRLADALARLESDATPLIRGAAGAARVLLGRREPDDFGAGLASRADGATSPELRAALAEFLRGSLIAAGPLLETGRALDPLLERVESFSDRAFLDRLPSLRAGFDVLAPAARSRLLSMVEDRTGAAVGALTGAVADPSALALLALADLAGREALAARGLRLLAPGGESGPVPNGVRRPATGFAELTVPGGAEASDVPGGRAGQFGDRQLSAGERWRLLLGRGRELGGGAARYAAALDELYGSGRGEGSRAEAGSGGRCGTGGGSEASYPDVRAWSEELSALFGPGIREEVLAAAADAGRLDAAFAMDPAAARPSVELLRTVLSYAGGMPEQQLARLRPLVARLVKELTEALANRMRPALTGLSHPRPTRRPGGALDLPRTLRANLTTARRDEATGAVSVLPERPVFRTRARRSTDWRLVLVVDVSGSMEASTVWSALTASVLAGVPALTTHFVAFSTEVLDLTDRVDDPLGLLLEVRVGGGTSIARGLRHARELVTVPSRTLVVVISDFEEGGPIGPLLSEVRTLVDAGCHVLGCASLDDEGRPRYSTGVAGRLVAAGMPIAALSPLELARWVGERVGGTHR